MKVFINNADPSNYFAVADFYIEETKDAWYLTDFGRTLLKSEWTMKV